MGDKMGRNLSHAYARVIKIGRMCAYRFKKLQMLRNEL